jgi:hypothetical protein
LALSTPAVGEALHVTAQVAWVSSQPPWRLGLCFDATSLLAAGRWFEKLLAANPGLGNFRRVPERLPMDAMVFLGPPPRFADFSADDLGVLRRIGSDATISSLRRRLQATWPVSQRILFALLSRGCLTLSRGAGTNPEAWLRVMIDLGVLPQEDEATPPPTLAYTPLPLPAVTPPPRPAAGPAPSPGGAAPQDADPAAVGRSAGTGWRGAGQRRSADAQEAFELGKAELAQGRVKVALTLLRRALQLAPGDAEVAAELGRAMKG